MDASVYAVLFVTLFASIMLFWSTKAKTTKKL